MDLSVKVTPHFIQGGSLAARGSFSQGFSYCPPNQDLRQARGQLFAVTYLTSPDPTLDLPGLAKLAWDSFCEEYFADPAGSPPSALSESLEKVQTRVKSLLVSPQSGQSKLLDFNLLGLVIWGNTYYLLRLGQGVFFLWRNQTLQSADDGQLVSGTLEKNDLLLLTTQHFLRSLGQEGIAQILRDNSPQEALACFKEEILQQKVPAQHALIAVLVQQNWVPSEDEIIEIIDVEVKNNQLKEFLARAWQTLKNSRSQAIGRLKSLNLGLPFTLKLPKLRLRSGALYIKNKAPGPRRTRVLFLALLIFIFTLSVWATHWFRQQQTNLEKARKQLTLVEQKLREGRQLASTDPEQSKKILQEAARQLEQVKGAKTTQKFLVKASLPLTKKSTLNQKSQNLAKEISQTLTENYKMEKLSVATTSAPWPQTIYQVSSKGITDPQEKVLLAKSPDWQKIIAVQNYFNNLYLLDVSANQIHKYLALAHGYSKRFNYFKKPVDLSGALDFTIDGSVYILFNQGRVQKYLGGQAVEFNLSGFFPELSKITGIFTSRNNQNLYLFGSNQVLVFNKDGVYQKGFELDKVEDIQELLTDESAKTIWLKTSSQIFTASY